VLCSAATIALVLAALAAPLAQAQEPTGGPLAPATKGVVVSPLQQRPLLGEPTGGSGDLPPYFASTPLRLSLMGEMYPIAAALGDDGCHSRTDASGNSVNGFPVQRYTMLSLSPRLVLHGFSRAGCPLDAGAGGGATYTLPLRSNLWLVASAGAYALPSQVPGRTVLKTDARIDLARGGSAHTLSIGLSRRGLSFGGLW
jgi:hypothetical protein